MDLTRANGGTALYDGVRMAADSLRTWRARLAKLRTPRRSERLEGAEQRCIGQSLAQVSHHLQQHKHCRNLTEMIKTTC